MCTIFNCSNRADGKKNKSYYRFHSIVTNNDKEDLTLSKVIREKSLAQFFGKDLTDRKLGKTRMKIMLSSYPSLFFHSKFTISDLKSKSVLYRN